MDESRRIPPTANPAIPSPPSSRPSSACSRCKPFARRLWRGHSCRRLAHCQPFRGTPPHALPVCLLVLVPAVVQLERPVLLRVHPDPPAFAVLVHIGDERVARIVLLAAAHRIVQLPHVRRPWSVVDGLPCLRRAALPRPVVHQRHLRR